MEQNKERDYIKELEDFVGGPLFEADFERGEDES